MTAPYADLIERLQDGGDVECPCPYCLEASLRNPDGPEAAEAIEALQADNERLQAEVTRLLTAFDGLDLTTKGEADE